MKALIKYYPNKINLIYDDITKYLTSVTNKKYEQLTFLPEKMNRKDISELAYIAYTNNETKIWLKMKEYILNNYTNNDLAAILLDIKNGVVERNKKEFCSDADTYFKTSANYQYYILDRQSDAISKELLESYMGYLKVFKRKEVMDAKLYALYHYELGKNSKNM